MHGNTFLLKYSDEIMSTRYRHNYLGVAEAGNTFTKFVETLNRGRTALAILRIPVEGQLLEHGELFFGLQKWRYCVH